MRTTRGLFGVAVLTAVMTPALGAQRGTNDGQWTVHGGDKGFTRYAPLDQINEENVNTLRIAWRRPAVDASLHARWPELQYSKSSPGSNRNGWF